jgi:hypothetical protein
MDWVWMLYERFVGKWLAARGNAAPTDRETEGAFVHLLSESTMTILVQEPWRGSVRFKKLAVLGPSRMFDLIPAPEAYLSGRFGGGKFKLNFHHGLHFVATRNFKPAGEPLWLDLPEFEPEHAA